MQIRRTGARAIHGSGGSGLCPTRNRPPRDRVLRVSFSLGEHWFRVKLKLAENHRKKEKIDEISLDPSKIQCNLARSGRDFAKSDAFSPKSCWESPDLVFWLPKYAKSCWKTHQKAWIRSWSFSFWAGRVERFLKEGTRNQTAGVGFWSSGPASNHWSSQVKL